MGYNKGVVPRRLQRPGPWRELDWSSHVCNLPDCAIPYGLCHCGCGQPTGIVAATSRTRGWFAGEPKRYILNHHRRGKTLPGRDDVSEFWKRTKRVGRCLHWTGTRKPGGYGNAYFGGKMEGAHRVAYILAHGPIPPGMDVCHSCDKFYPVGDTTYRRCVDDTHLFLGTAEDNARDAVEKGRISRGSRHKASMFTEEQVIRLRAEFRAYGGTLVSFAQKYHHHRGTMGDLLYGRRWRHVPGALVKGFRTPQILPFPTDWAKIWANGAKPYTQLSLDYSSGPSGDRTQDQPIMSTITRPEPLEIETNDNES